MQVNTNSKKITLFGLLSFLVLGIPRVVTTAAATALFLQSFGAEMLPLTYIIAAILAPAVNTLYIWLQGRISLWNLILVALFLDALVLVLSWVGIGSGWATGFILLAMVWVEVEWMLVDLVFFGLSGRMFTIREMKSVLGRIGSGEPIAVISVGIAIPALLGYLETRDLFLISGVSILLAMGIIVMIHKNYGEDLQEESEEEEGAVSRVKPAEEKKNPFSFGKYTGFVRLIFATTFFAQIIHFLIDTAFCSISEEAYTTEAELASFLAVFMALTGGVNLIFNLFISERFMRRFGVGMGLIAFPVINGLMALGGILVDQIPFQVGLFFFAVSLLKLNDESMRSGLYLPSLQTVFQPLPPGLRTRAHAFNGGYVEQVAGGIGGLGLLFLTTVLGWGAPGLLMTGSVLMVGWLYMNRNLGKKYIETLGEAFRKRRVSMELILSDPEVIKTYALKSLHSERPTEAIFGLQLLEQLDRRTDFVEGVRTLLGSPDPGAKKTALQTIAKSEMIELLPEVQSEIREEEDPNLRAHALHALASIEREGAIEELEGFLDSREPELQVAAFGGLMQHCGIEGTLICGERFLRLHRSSSQENRLLSAKILDEIASPQTYRLIKENIKSVDSRIRRLAFRTAARLDSKELWPVLLSATTSPRDGTVAASALLPAGEKIIPWVVGILDGVQTESTRHRLVRLLGQLKGEQAIGWLLANMGKGTLEGRWRVAKALDSTGFVAVDLETRDTLLMMAIECLTIQDHLRRLRIPDDSRKSQAIKEWIVYGIHLQTERFFMILARLYASEKIIQAYRKLELGKSEEKDYALELIDSMLPVKLKSQVIPHLEEVLRLEDSDLVARWETGMDHDLLSIVLNRDGWFGPEIRAASLLLFSRRGETIDPELLQELRSEPAMVLARTAAHIQDSYKTDRRDRSRRKAPMLPIEKVILMSSIPTFSELPATLLGDLVAVTEEWEYSAGDWLMREGEAGDRLFIIVEGAAQVMNGDRILAEVGVGDVVGEMSALDPEIRSASIRAKTPVVCLSLDHENLEDLMAGSVELAQGFIRMLTRRLRENIHRLNEMGKA